LLTGEKLAWNVEQFPREKGGTKALLSWDVLALLLCVRGDSVENEYTTTLQTLSRTGTATRFL
jgi:hypothetical protein